MSYVTNPLPPFLLNASQVAKRLGVSKPYAYDLMRKRKIPVVVMGRSVRVRPEDLEKFIVSSLEMGANGKTSW